MAPEIWLNKDNFNPQQYDGKKVDIFALGVILFVLKLGYTPF
jgi:serine/threonine protein kinase